MRKLLGCTRSSRRVRSPMACAVIVDARAVGGADLAQRRAGARHDLGDAEAIADFDQLAARDYHLAARRQFVERQQQRRGIIVDGNGGRAQQPLQQRPGVDIALAALAGCKIVFQVGVAGLEGKRGQRRASQVGVEHHAGGVDDAPQRRPGDGVESPFHAGSYGWPRRHARPGYRGVRPRSRAGSRPPPTREDSARLRAPGWPAPHAPRANRAVSRFPPRI